MRYAHNAERALELPSQSVALLAALMLRGPQTAGELRINSDRMHRFADISAVEGFLHELAAHPGMPLVAELPRAPGSRETRWMHLLGGTPPAEMAYAVPIAVSSIDASNWNGEIAALREELAELRARIAALEKRIG
jgi:uncharacterized protein YceH (UPF0502 family)